MALMQSGRNSGALAARGSADLMTALQVGAPGERHFGTVKKCYPCCRIKVLPMLPVDQRKPVLSQGAERFFISQIGFSAPCYCNGPLISCVKASCHPEPTEQRE